VAIRTFGCADTEAPFRLRRVARFANIERLALRKLKHLDLARRRPTGSNSGRAIARTRGARG
jgi:hypothetical protein